MLFNSKNKNLVAIIAICYFFVIGNSIALEVPDIWNVPKRNTNFFGREAELKRIKTILGNKNITYLYGIGGVGKTQIAKEYAHQNLDYDLVWWFDSAQDLTMQYTDLFKAILRSDKLKHYVKDNLLNISPEATVAYMNDLLRRSEFSWLIVFDNCTDIEKIYSVVPENHSAYNKHVLITTRQNLDNHDTALKVGPFSKSTATLFVSKFLPALSSADINILVNELNYLPLQLCHAISFLNTNQTPVVNYIKKHRDYQQRSNQVFRKYKHINDGYNKSMFSVLEASIRMIKTTNPNAYEVLLLCAILDYPVPDKLFIALVTDVTGKDFVGNDVVVPLTEYLFLEASIKEGKKYYHLHDVIKEHIGFELDQNLESKKLILRRLIKIVNNQIKQDIFDNFQLLDEERENIIIAKNILITFINLGQKDVNALKLAIKLIKANNILFTKHAKYEDYQSITKVVYSHLHANSYSVELISELYGESVFLDFIYSDLSTIEKFQQGFNRVLYNKYKSTQNNFFLYTQSAQYHLFVGDFNKSYKHIIEAQKFVKLARNLSELVQFYYTYCWILLELRKMEECNQRLKEFKTIIDKYKVGQVAQLYYMNFKSKLAYLAGDNAESVRIAEECMKLSQQYYQSKVNDTFAEGLITKAQIALEYNQTEKAKLLLEEAQCILKNIFGGDNVDLSQAFLNTLLGEISSKNGNLKAAIKKYEQAESFYQKIHVSKSINSEERLRLYKNLSKSYYQVEDFTKSKIYFRKLLFHKGFNNQHVKSLLLELGDNFLDKM